MAYYGAPNAAEAFSRGLESGTALASAIAEGQQQRRNNERQDRMEAQQDALLQIQNPGLQISKVQKGKNGAPDSMAAQAVIPGTENDAVANVADGINYDPSVSVRLQQAIADRNQRMELAKMEAELRLKQQFPANKFTSTPMGDILNTSTGDLKSSQTSATAPIDKGQADASGRFPDVLQNYSPEVQRLAQGLVDYKLPLPANTTRNPIYRQALDAAMQLDPNFDASQYKNRQAVNKSFQSGTDASNVASLNTVIGHLGKLSDSIDALHNHGGVLTPLNGTLNAIASATGNSATGVFDQTANAVANELGKTFKGGASTDAETKSWRAGLHSSDAPNQIRDKVAGAVGLIASRLSALNDKYQSGMGRPKDRQFLNAESRKTLQKLGINPDDLEGKIESRTSVPTASDTGNPFPEHAQDQQALEWAKQNPDNPMAAKILHLNGL